VIPTLETSRLILRPLELADAEQTQVLFPQWEIVRYLAGPIPWPYPPDGAYRHFHEKALPAMERGEAWHWTLRLKSSTENMIGAINLRTSDKDNRGFWLGLQWHRQGLMTEAATAVTDFWFDSLKFELLRVSKAVGNTASRRISENSGMRMVGTEERNYVSGRLPVEIWEVTAAEWRAQRSC
jgi:RimJ/RimL family protein N-acetyltransferase